MSLPDNYIAFGITTCPRQGGFRYLAETLDSLKDAGFEKPRIFDDPDRELSAYGNSLRALGSLISEFPDSAYYLIWQDDIRVTRNLRDYLERTVKFNDAGAINLFTPIPRATDRPGWFKADLEAKTHRSTIGGLALMFPAASARMLVANPPKPGTRQGWDNRVRDHCIAHGLPMWYHNPSLVDHIGVISSIAVWPELWPDRNCREFCLDARTLS